MAVVMASASEMKALRDSERRQRPSVPLLISRRTSTLLHKLSKQANGLSLDYLYVYVWATVELSNSRPHSSKNILPGLCSEALPLA